jgi:soluble lytic murein transglycosylase-like protein
MRKIIVIPAVFIGCLVVIWVGTVAAAGMPAEALLSPTMTAAALEQPVSQEAPVIEAAAGAETEKAGAKTAQTAAPPAENTSCTLPLSYPEDIRQWCHLIEKSAAATGLPANLIAAVMLQESGGDPVIYSSSGAVGLMQVMPRDGLAADFMCVNGPCFSDRPTIAELQDPAFNVAYGSQMLADLYARHGSYREALFKYGPINMGYYYADLVLKIWENYQ